ncbi:MAG: DUF3857 domain-containing protein [Phycisphaerales bacterium]|nr:MAG: DUF3857 domain-containing protein [Phycisphaerales bacterium]
MTKNRNDHGFGRTYRVVASAVLALLAGGSGCHATPAAAPAPQGAEAPGPAVEIAQFPEADAVILRWEQDWVLEQDGTVRRREHKWTKLLNRRPIRRLADPRIDHCVGEDELTIHTARTILPDGTTLPVPDYAINLAGPDDVAGWPAYIDWVQTVVSFPGIEAGAVLELDYEIVTKPGVLPWLEADLTLDDDDPVVERVVSVTVPENTLRFDCLTGTSPPVESSNDGVTTSVWTFTNSPGVPAEPQSPSWRERCNWLRFTTCPGAEKWVAMILTRVEQAARPDDAIRTFAEAVVEDEVDPAQRVRKIAKTLQDSFNFVDSLMTRRSLTCRPAADVFRSNYGGLLESAALCAAAVRALGVDASVRVAVDGGPWAWNEKAPTASVLAGVIVVVETPGGPVHIHPQHGVFTSPGSWGKHWLLSLTDTGGLRSTYVEARGETKPSELHVTGKVTIGAEGQADGDLRIRLTGAFYDPAKLETSGGQERLMQRLAERILTGFDVKSHSIATLSDETLRATAAVASNKPLKKVGARHLLRFGDGPAFLVDFPMPLDRSYRRTDVRLAGRLRQEIDLTVELPEGWTAPIVPASLPTVEGDWGTIGQTVQVEGASVRIRQSIAVSQDVISPEAFAGLRRAVNALRADASLMLACGP